MIKSNYISAYFLNAQDRDEDLSEAELRECWADGSLGTTRVEREGFGRVWKEVSDYFEGDIMEEARKTAAKALKKKRTSTENEVMKVGETMSAAEIQNASDAVKQLSGDDMDIMLDRMENMGALEESRLKGMGVDPTMMKKAAEMMKGNPMMKNAAQTLMKNMSPEQMMKASEQAQSQLKGMSTEDMEEAMNKMKDSGKQSYLLYQYQHKQRDISVKYSNIEYDDVLTNTSTLEYVVRFTSKKHMIISNKKNLVDQPHSLM